MRLSTVIQTLAVLLLTTANALAGERLIDNGPHNGPPPAFEKFCDDYATLCNGGGWPDVIHLTPEKLAQLDAVKDRVDRRVDTRGSWPKGARGDRWHVLRGPGRGDCADATVTALAELKKEGWPLSVLRPTYVLHPEGAHMVLTVETDQGTYVLDNLREDVRPLSSRQFKEYRFLSRRGRELDVWVLTERQEA